jgi:HAD superfamily hydrolase (TIGR01459 family)
MTTQVTAANVITGLADIAGNYDSFVFDQFGILHDGKALYPGVPDILQELKTADKYILVLTNSGRSADENLARLADRGINISLLDGIVTSGDVARDKALPAWVTEFGRRCFHLGSPGENSARTLAGVPGIEIVDRISECDFVYLSAMSVGLAETWHSAYVPELLSAGVPLLCSNPDFQAPSGQELRTSPGALAKVYGDAGGKVELIGKPWPLIYQAVADRLVHAGRHKPLFIGDSYHHDICGARNVGHDALMVLTGIHQQSFAGRDIADTANHELIQDGIAPTWISRTL